MNIYDKFKSSNEQFTQLSVDALRNSFETLGVLLLGKLKVSAFFVLHSFPVIVCGKFCLSFSCVGWGFPYTRRCVSKILFHKIYPL